MKVTALTWAPFGPGWFRTALVCGGCQAETHDPAAFAWRGYRDGSGLLQARCRRCAPISKGRAADPAYRDTPNAWNRRPAAPPKRPTPKQWPEDCPVIRKQEDV